jgi:PhnB protein
MADPEAAGPASGLNPHITIRDGRADEAIAFYARAFGAVEMIRVMADDGKRILHARLAINGGLLMLNDDFAEYSTVADTRSAPPSGVVLHLQVDDADAWWARAVAAGMSVRYPLVDQFWGDRYGHVDDPFGFVWSIGGPIRTG